MTQLLTKAQQDGIVKFEEFKAQVEELRKDYGGLTIAGIGDEEGYKVVSDAKARTVTLRNKIEKRRKEIKEPVLKLGKDIDAAAKKYSSLVTGLEDELAGKLKAIDDEKARIAQEAERKLDQRLQERVSQLTHHSYCHDLTLLRTMPEGEFSELLSKVAAEALIRRGSPVIETTPVQPGVGEPFEVTMNEPYYNPSAFDPFDAPKLPDFLNTTRDLKAEDKQKLVDLATKVQVYFHDRGINLAQLKGRRFGPK